MTRVFGIARRLDSVDQLKGHAENVKGHALSFLQCVHAPGLKR